MSLPWELILDIIRLVVSDVPRHPTPLILVNSTFRDLCLSYLHAELRFRSVQQLDDFVNNTTYLVSYPRSVSVNLAGGTADFRLFTLLHGVFDHCLKLLRDAPPLIKASREATKLPMRLNLQRIYFCLNSHTVDENSKYLQEALSLTDPEEFTWIGPDPGHHFSIAIVPIAVFYLFRGIQTWTRLRHLKLTNLAFPLTPSLTFEEPLPRAFGLVSALNKPPPLALSNSSQCSEMPLTQLESVYLGQITFLYPSEIALIACAPELVSLRSIRVVDAYQGSIWGPRVRLPDVEKAAAHLYMQTLGIDDLEGNPIDIEFLLKRQIQRVQALVKCEGKTERIMGGDRMDVAT